MQSLKKTSRIFVKLFLTWIILFPHSLIAQTQDNNALLTLGELLAEAQLTLYKMGNHREFKDQIMDNLRDAKALIIIPKRVKGGLVFGAEGGKGILVARTNDGKWSYPAFYDLGGGSIGLQIGIETSQIMTMVMTDRGLASLLEDRIAIGGELSAAVGTIGSGVEAGTTRNLDIDFFSYGISSGAFIGANIEGSILIPDNFSNSLFYGQDNVTPEAIIVEGKHSNTAAESLRVALDQLSTLAQ